MPIKGILIFFRRVKKVRRITDSKGREHILDYPIDTLVVGVDRDKTVSLKGPGRPVFDLETRCEMMAALSDVDLVFPLPFALREYSASEESKALFRDLTLKIRPNILVTNELADPFWMEKKERAEELGICYLGLKIERPTSSNEIAERILRL